MPGNAYSIPEDTSLQETALDQPFSRSHAATDFTRQEQSPQNRIFSLRGEKNIETHLSPGFLIIQTQLKFSELGNCLPSPIIQLPGGTKQSGKEWEIDLEG